MPLMVSRCSMYDQHFGWCRFKRARHEEKYTVVQNLVGSYKSRCAHGAAFRCSSSPVFERCDMHSVATQCKRYVQNASAPALCACVTLCPIRGTRPARLVEAHMLRFACISVASFHETQSQHRQYQIITTEI